MENFDEILKSLKLRKLGETLPPEAPALPDLFEMEEFKDGPAMEQYQGHLRQGMPDTNEFQPGPVKGILAALAGALTGFGTNNAVAGASVGRGIIDAPLNRATVNYDRKTKELGNLAEIEEQGLNKKRLFRQHREDLDRKRQADEDRKLANEERIKALKDKPPRQNKPEIEYDEMGYATGRFWDPDEATIKSNPDLKGFRRSAESPAITQKKSANKVALDKATELQGIFDKLTAKGKSGTWHVGPLQGSVSDWLTSAGAIDDPDVRNLHKLTQELANERLYAMSGAQINNKEYERLRATMADTNKSEASFRADLARFLKFHEAAMQGLISENDVDWTPESANTQFPTGTPTQAPTRKFKVTRLP